MNRKSILIIAAILGAIAVAFGAFGAHSLKDRLAPAALEIWKTGALYQMFHALALLGISAQPNAERFKTTAILWLVGTLIFAGSLYALALTDIKILGAITPLGGLAYIAGWIALIPAANKKD